MKKASFGFFLQNFEKLVLGAAGVFLLAVLAIYWGGVLGPAITVKSPSGEVSLGEIREKVNNEANRLRQALDSTEPRIPSRQVPDWPQAHSERYKLPVTQGPMLARIDTPGHTDADLNPADVERTALFLPTPPLAGTYIIKTGHAVLADPRSAAEDEERTRVEALQRLVSNRQPTDFQYVWVAADFPVREWAQRLAAEGQPRDKRIPPNVWQTRFGLAGVYLMRQEQDPLTGEWGSETLIQPLPGQLAYTDNTILPDLRSEDAAARIQQLLASQSTVAQPTFPPVAHSDPTPPSEQDRALSPEEQERRRTLEREIKALERRLQNMAGENANTRRRPEVGGAADFPEGAATGRRTPPRAAAGANANEQRQADQRMKQLEEVTQQLADKRAELNTLLGIQEDASVSQFLGGGAMEGGFMADEFGNMPEGMGGFGPPPGVGRPRNLPGQRAQGGATPTLGPGQPGEGFVSTMPERLRVWAQDLSAQPGRTYRYKVIVTVLNPLFQYTRVPAEQREINEFKIALGPSADEQETTPWSPAVAIENTSYFFLVAANAADAISPARARVSVWRVFDGQWRQREFTENPGNPIGGIVTITTQNLGAQPVDMHVGAVVLDIDPINTGSSRDVRVLYLDEATGTIQARFLNADKKDPKLEDLDKQSKQQDTTAAAN